MQVALERLPNSVAKVSVTIDPAEMSVAMDKAFRSVVSKYNIPGFRRGKVPRPIFERYVGREVLLREAADKLVKTRYTEAVLQAAIEPVAEPSIKVVTLEDGSPFQFDIEVETKPIIELGDYHDLLTIPLTVREVTDEDIEQELQSVARSQAQLIPADDEPVSMGNHIIVKLKGFLEGDESEEPFVEDEAYAIEMGSGTVV
ncbi:MAG: trigger factor, partial [Firmicutes bacterium]|nr:trigger factor [Bacillota bacterium]